MNARTKNIGLVALVVTLIIAGFAPIVFARISNPPASGGITSLEGLTGATQTFTDDTNVTIVSGGTAHVITWAGTLADARITSAATWNAKLASADIDTCSEFATIMAGETGTCGGVVLSADPNFSGKLAIASSSPFATLAVNPIAGVASNQFVVGSSTATSFLITNAGFGGFGTTSPYAQFSVHAPAGFDSFAVGSSTDTWLKVTSLGTTTIKKLDVTGTATSSFTGNGINLTSGCFSIANTCVGGSSGTFVEETHVKGNVNVDVGNTSASTTVYSITVPANTISTTKAMRVTALYWPTGTFGACKVEVKFGNGTATTSYGAFGSAGVSTDPNNLIRQELIMMSTSTGTQYGSTVERLPDGTGTHYSNQSNYSLTATTYLQFIMKPNASDNNNHCTFLGAFVEKI